MDELVEQMSFGNYSLLKLATKSFLKSNGKSPIAQISPGSQLISVSGSAYQIEMHKQMVDHFDHGQFIGNVKTVHITNLFIV